MAKALNYFKFDFYYYGSFHEWWSVLWLQVCNLEQFKSRVMNEILGNVQGMMPKVLEKGLPDLTGPSLPVPPKGLGI